MREGEGARGAGNGANCEGRRRQVPGPGVRDPGTRQLEPDAYSNSATSFFGATRR